MRIDPSHNLRHRERSRARQEFLDQNLCPLDPFMPRDCNYGILIPSLLIFFNTG